MPQIGWTSVLHDAVERYGLTYSMVHSFGYPPGYPSSILYVIKSNLRRYKDLRFYFSSLYCSLGPSWEATQGVLVA